MVVGTVEAAQLAGCSRQTIWRKIKAGALSATIGPDGGHRLDTSELVRVFGELQLAQPSPAVTVQPGAQPDATTDLVTALQARIADLEHNLELARRDLDVEREERRGEREERRLLQSRLLEVQSRLLELTDRYVRLLPAPAAPEPNRPVRPRRPPRSRSPRPRSRTARSEPAPPSSLAELVAGVANRWLGGTDRGH